MTKNKQPSQREADVVHERDAYETRQALKELDKTLRNLSRYDYEDVNVLFEEIESKQD